MISPPFPGLYGRLSHLLSSIAVGLMPGYAALVFLKIPMVGPETRTDVFGQVASELPCLRLNFTNNIVEHKYRLRAKNSYDFLQLPVLLEDYCGKCLKLNGNFFVFRKQYIKLHAFGLWHPLGGTQATRQFLFQALHEGSIPQRSPTAWGEWGQAWHLSVCKMFKYQG